MGHWRAHLIGAEQTFLDGVPARYAGHLPEGALWRWEGAAVRLAEPLAAEPAETLSRAVGARHARVGLMRVFGRSDFGRSLAQEPVEALSGPAIEVTDGRRRYRATLIARDPEAAGADAGPLLMFTDGIPRAGTDCRFLRASGLAETVPRRRVRAAGHAAGFHAAAVLTTPTGPRAAGALREGDLVLTRDAGALPVARIRRRRMTGARFFAMPHLRPLAMRRPLAGLTATPPDRPLAPHQPLVLRHRLVRRVYGAREVLIEARDLADAGLAAPLLSLAHAEFVEIGFDRHVVLEADGLLMGSALPPGCRPGAPLPETPAEAEAELAARPARRFLTRAEAAVLIGRILAATTRGH